MKKVDTSKFPKGILLDIGCRDRKQVNFVGMDKKKREGVDIVHDPEDFPYPLDDGCCMTIKAQHVVEHIKPWLFFDFFDELWRLLIPNGQVMLNCPYGHSKGFYQDPTHCTHITKETWQYLDPQFVLYNHYRPKPWRLEHIALQVDGNVEVILRKLTEKDAATESELREKK